ncbi:MAG: NAD(P)/FAD-dependent oxidoreductase [Tropicimonas sp.]|uniref:NAD(P)/FAD-dependent oxidoreductase n=1 Tax=Tropicimonas sp. TaxID=2067044 RepID=UPI003A84736C
MAKRVVIVGGGYVGAELARALERRADVTLVEQREAFCHAPALIRATISPDLLERALLPYDRLLERGNVVRARAISVDGAGVTLADGRRLAADIIVIATGSTHGRAFKARGQSVEGLRGASRALHEAVTQATEIAIVGGGALGVELAGEIRAARPRKRVTLISDTPLLHGYPPRLGRDLARRLDALGVDCITGARAVELPGGAEPFAGPVTLEDGRVIAADLTIPALGSTPSTTLLETLPGLRKGPDGRALTDGWMRPSALPNVFAAGDAAENGDAMTIVGVSRQVPWLTRAIAGLLEGKPPERGPAYAPWPRPPILVPLGPHMGASILPVVGLVGSGPTRMIKGRDLFVPKYRRLFGLC